MKGACLRFDNREDLKIFLEEVKAGDIAKIYTSTGRVIHFKPTSDDDYLKTLSGFFSPNFSAVGLYVDPPHGNLIINGKQKLIARPVNLTSNINTPLYLLSGSNSCGVIEIGYSKKVSLKEFKKLFSEHRISEPERLSKWPDVSEFFVYNIKLIRSWNVYRKWRTSERYTDFVSKITFIDTDNRRIKKPFDDVISDEIDRIGNWFMLEENNLKHKYIVQHHMCGDSIHTDLRFETDSHLIGWTLDSHADIKSKSRFLNFNELIDDSLYKISSVKKLMEPKIWLKVKGKLSPGSMGSGVQKSVELIVKSRGHVRFGVQKSNFHEYFLEPDGNGDSDDNIKGRWLIARIKFSDSQDVWVTWKPKDQREYVKSHNFEEERNDVIRSKIDMVWQGNSIEDRRNVVGKIGLLKTAKHFF